MTRQDEVEAKVARVRSLLQASGRRGALLVTHANFAWVTGGGQNHVSVTTERGAGGILVTGDAVYLLADNIESRRFLEEELAGVSLELREFPWWSGNLVQEAARIVPTETLIADIPVPGAHSLDSAATMALRNPLLPVELERYRALGADVAVVLTHAAFYCRPGLSEHQLAGMLGKGLMDFGITPAVTLAACDQRIYTRRHPIPTANKLERYAMLVVGGRRGGLNVSSTRLIHFGEIPAELKERHLACARVDAAFLAATRPGNTLADVFRAGQAAYAAEGYPDEWQHHHQGGPTGYAGRDAKGTLTATGEVLLHQAFAWNPSIAGTKSEDTAIVTEGGIEIISRTPDLPEVEVEVAGQRFRRAAILER